MFGINEVINYIRFLRHKEELEGLIKRHILIKKPKCTECGFEYNTIEDIYEKLPIISYDRKNDNYDFVCNINECREKSIRKLFEVKSEEKIKKYIKRKEKT